MRIVYFERQAALRSAIDALLGDRVTVSGGRAGIHLLYLFNGPVEDDAVAGDALAEGVVARPLSHCYLEGTHRRRGLMLGYAGVPVEGIRPAAERLAGVIERHAEVRGRAKRRSI